jgi:hypothetical protein
MDKIKYFFKRKTEQIKRLVKWIPVIWKQYDFDYVYSIEVFKLKLGELADTLESDKTGTNSTSDSKRVRTAIDLMDKVYNEYYSEQCVDRAYAKYGEKGFVRTKKITDKDILKELGGGYHYDMDLIWLRSMSDEETKEADAFYIEMIMLGEERQKRAHKLLWEFIEHNIKGWWC